MMTRKQAREYRARIEHAAATQSDEQALQSVELYPKWDGDIDVLAGERYQYEGKLFKVIQSHHTQADWTPAATPSLFAEVGGIAIDEGGNVDVDEWPEWEQKQGAHDAYQEGDKVTFNGKHYSCITPNNIYAPNVYGWEPEE